MNRSTPYFRNLDGEVYFFDSEPCLRAFDRWQAVPEEDFPWGDVQKTQDR